MRNVFVERKVSMGDREHSVYLKIFDYKRVGDISLLKLFNWSIYQRVGDIHKLFFWVWGR